ncbi:hypothetical protein PR202_ga11501 [Eleusine coracana subsp. coracana]|uniref:DUF4005 domain-containing protein n=1 Tax=Eleusine coracana subsp. coracana TaxID=191504 RepID=A0AAV5C978_ELECO|nr:hypothetical protein PR202_ga11501 [Eleusine coracana subsp. coracana]
MGKAARWFRNILGKKDQSSKEHNKPKPEEQHPLPPANAKRWSFGKSSRDSAAAAAGGSGSDAAIARAAEAAWLRSAAYGETERERAQSKHAIAVAAATAAAADAAVAAAQAAVAVVRLTSKGPPPVLATAGGRAAVRIQTAFRGFLAKKALRALKAIVKLQALVRGYLVRRQAAATLQSMQALIRAQAAVRAQRAAAALHSHHHPPVRPRYSLQDDTRSEHGGTSRRMSASIDSSSSTTYGYDRSPKIVEVDPGQGQGRPKSRSSSSSSARRASAPLTAPDAGSEDWSANSVISSPLPCSYHFAPGPPRIATSSRHHQFPDHDCCATARDSVEKARPATAQSTPRYMTSSFAPPTPAKSVAGCGGGYSPSLLNCPGYMSSTQSSEAKSRSQSAPKQRPELCCAAGGGRKRVPLSEVVVAVEAARASLHHHRASCNSPAQEGAFSFKAAVVGRMDRTLEVAGVENDRLAFLQRRW